MFGLLLRGVWRIRDFDYFAGRLRGTNHRRQDQNEQSGPCLGAPSLRFVQGWGFSVLNHRSSFQTRVGIKIPTL